MVLSPLLLPLNVNEVLQKIIKIYFKSSPNKSVKLRSSSWRLRTRKQTKSNLQHFPWILSDRQNSGSVYKKRNLNTCEWTIASTICLFSPAEFCEVWTETHITGFYTGASDEIMFLAKPSSSFPKTLGGLVAKLACAHANVFTSVQNFILGCFGLAHREFSVVERSMWPKSMVLYC